MSSWIAVARRELHGRRVALAGALGLGVVPLGLPRLVAGTSGAELRLAATAVLALAYVGILALVVGGGMLGGELAERRLGFYFARPLSTAAIFAGKVAALLVLLVGAQLFVWLPTLICDGSRADLAPAVAVLMAATPLFVGVGLVAGVAARCRSRWLAVDIAVTVAGLWLFALVARQLAFEVWLHPGAPLRLFGAVGGALGIFSVALLAGAAAALARGRVDAMRAHRAMSVVLVATLLPAGGAALAATRALERTDIHRLSGVTAASGDGDWIYVSGPVAGQRAYEPDFLWQRSTGRWRQLGVIMGGPLPSFAPDGARVAWIETDNPLAVWGDHAKAVDTLVVGEPGDARHERRAPTGDDAMAIAWSPDGRWLALLGEKRIELRDTGTLRTRATVEAPGGARFVRARFAGDGLRAFALDGEGVTGLTVSARGTTTLARVATHAVWIDASPRGDRILAARADGAVDLLALDGAARTLLAAGGRVAAPSPPMVGFEQHGGFLPDGSIALGFGGDAERAGVRLFDRDGGPTRTVELGVGRVIFGPVTSRGLLIAIDANPTPSQKNERLFLIAPDGGAHALDPRWRLQWTLDPAIAQTPASHPLLRDDDNRLLAWDPATDRATPLLPGR